jgi:indolepyruvate ferredoxin oxidoreductase beta subunit
MIIHHAGFVQLKNNYRMKKDIIIAGVGGQGILSIAATIGTAALIGELNMKQSEVHGMAQRGGAVQSHLRLSSEPILSDLVTKGKADMILSMEPMEALRYLPYLGQNGWIVTNAKPYENISNYPPLEEIYSEIRKYKNHLIIDADEVAKELNTSKSANIVLVGAAAQKLGLDFNLLEAALRQIFIAKGEDVVQANLAALHAGQDIARG